jgi:hypothetical protein
MAALRAKLVVRITPDDVGRRVSVRARHHGPEASTVDVVGMLERWEGGGLTVTRRDGTTAWVADEDLLAGRVVPPAPDRRRRSSSGDTP